jgi:hypothetical protein
MTKNLFDGVHVMFGPRFDKGYTPEYLCEMKKGGETVYLWKLSFKDGGDDMLLQFAMKDNKVSGFRFL